MEIESLITADSAEFFAKLGDAGAALISCDVVTDLTISALMSWRRNQPGWSDMPFIILTDRPEPGEPPGDGTSVYADIGNVTLVERPCLPQTLTSAARSALRARERQLQLAIELDERHQDQQALFEAEQRFRAELEDLVRVRTVCTFVERGYQLPGQITLAQCLSEWRTHAVAYSYPPLARKPTAPVARALSSPSSTDAWCNGRTAKTHVELFPPQ